MEKLVRRQDDIDTESVSGWVGLEERARFESRSSALSRAIFWVIVKFIEARDRWIINTGRNGRSWIHYPPFHSLERERLRPCLLLVSFPRSLAWFHLLLCALRRDAASRLRGKKNMEASSLCPPSSFSQCQL